MHHHSLAFRLTAATALAGVLSGIVAPAYAQTPPLPLAPGQTAPVAQAPGPQFAAPVGNPVPTAGDPPGRVGRVARMGGTVSFHTADADHWEPATLNEPVTSGNSFWTQPGASSDLEIGSARIVLDQTSEFTVDQLDDQNFVATAAQGRLFLRLRNIAPGETNTIRTPRGTVVIGAPGDYEITVGDTETPTVVTVHEGAATITGPGVSLSIGAHQSAQVNGAETFSGVVVGEVSDPFLQGQLERDHPPRSYGNVAPPPVVEQMTGYEAVADTGVWDDTPDYGRIWYPPVSVGWAPYREGHWAFIAPWGWTWVDDAPWGFAPFHYGRWVQWHDRWGWVPVAPGVEYGVRPVYSPALVAFVGAGVGVAVGLGIGAAVGWIPLGPREPYRPPYAVSPGYLQRVNVTNVTNITTINNYNRPPNGYVNAHAATMAPGSAFQQSQNLRGVAQPVPGSQLSSFQPLAHPGVTPTYATQGVTPGVARSMNLPAANTTIPPRSAPGPAFQPHSAPVMPGGAVPPSNPPQVPHAGGMSGAALGVGAAVGAAAVVGGAAALHHFGNSGAPQGGLPALGQHGTPPAPSQPGPNGRFNGTPQGGFPQGGAGQGGASPGSVPQYQRPSAPIQGQTGAPQGVFGGQPQRPFAPTPAPTPTPTPAPAPTPPGYQPRAQGSVPNYQPRPASPPPPAYQPPPHVAQPQYQPQYQPRVVTPSPQPPPAPIFRPSPPPPPAPQHEAPQHHSCPPGQPRC